MENVQTRIDSKIFCENVSKGDDLNHELSKLVFFSIVQGRNGKKINKIEMALQSITKCFENNLYRVTKKEWTPLLYRI